MRALQGTDGTVRVQLISWARRVSAVFAVGVAASLVVLGAAVSASATTLTPVPVPVTVTTPDAPTAVTVIAGDGLATVSFTPPLNPGSSVITGYTVTATDTTTAGNGGQVVSGLLSPIVITGLTNGDNYTFTATATNTAGVGAVSAASTPITPLTLTPVPVTVTTPDAPTAVTVIAGDGLATTAVPLLAATGSDQVLPVGLAGILLLVGLAFLGAARLASRSRKPHIG